jgi:hypothetical protein
MNRNKEKSERALGVMQMSQRRRYTEPSYVRVLIQHDLLTKQDDLQTAFGRWLAFTSDTQVRKLAMAIDAKKMRHEFVSITAPYKHGAAVLASMSKRQLKALRLRLNMPVVNLDPA